MNAYNAYLEVDCAAICNNIHSISAQTGTEVAIIPVLKCDAYGLGAAVLAREIAANTAVATFAVAQVGEGIALRQAGIGQDILVLAGVPEGQLPPAIEHNLTLCAHSPRMVRALGAAAAQLGLPARVHLKIDTGLHRLGAAPGPQLDALLAAIQSQPSIQITGTYSHFVDAETHDSPLALRQLALFREALHQLHAAHSHAGLVHMSASGASDWLPDANFDALRLGRRLFMDRPDHPLPQGTPGAVLEAATLRATIVHTRTLAAGESIGYGPAFTADSPTTVGIISIGYGDGLDERLGPAQAPILVAHHRHPAHYLSLCMDQAFIDITHHPAEIGDEVTIFGHSPSGAFLSGQDVAGTFGQEGVYITSRLGQRVERRYTGRTTVER